MDPNSPYAQSGSAFTGATTYDAGLRAHMVSIYNTVAAGLAVSGIVAYLIAVVPVLRMLFMNPIAIIISFVAILILTFTGFRGNRYSLQTNTSTMMSNSANSLRFKYYLFTTLWGIILSSLFLNYTGETLARVFFITTGMFAATSLVGYTTKRDLLGMGQFMIMGLIGLIIASVVNIFMHSSAVGFAISVLSVIVFTGLIAFQSQAAKRMYSNSNSAEDNQKLVVIHAVSLYLNFINLFTTLLNIFGGRR